MLCDGRLWLPNVKHYYNPSPQEYCVEMLRTEAADPILRVAVCNINRKVEHLDDKMFEVRLVIFPILLFLSSVALILTILVYGIIAWQNSPLSESHPTYSHEPSPHDSANWLNRNNSQTILYP